MIPKAQKRLHTEQSCPLLSEGAAAKLAGSSRSVTAELFQPPILLPASTPLKQEKKALAKLSSSFTASLAPFY